MASRIIYAADWRVLLAIPHGTLMLTVHIYICIHVNMLLQACYKYPLLQKTTFILDQLYNFTINKTGLDGSVQNNLGKRVEILQK